MTAASISARLAAAVIVATPMASASAMVAADTRPQLSDPGRSGEAHRVAEELLRHVYAVYRSVRACDEASREARRPDYAPGLTLDEARQNLRSLGGAAREAGIDVERIWTEIAPVAVATAAALKRDVTGRLRECGRLGGIFRLDVANLQSVLGELGSRRSLIERGF